MVIYALASILFCLILAIGLRLRKTLTGSGLTEGLEERSFAFYAPMERLLSEADFRFLNGRKEIPKAAIRQLRSDRRRVFRRYLGYLSLDFASIMKQLRAILVESDVSRPDLTRQLIRIQLLFAFAVLAIEARLMLHACGIHTITVSATWLTENLSNMRIELRQIQSVSSLSVA